MAGIPFVDTGGGGFSGSSSSSAAQTQSFQTSFGANQGINFGTRSDGGMALSSGAMVGLGIAAVTLAVLFAYKSGRKKKGQG